MHVSCCQHIPMQRTALIPAAREVSAAAMQVLYDELTEQVFLMLHSGSRNIGNTTAQHYDKAAARDMQQRGISGPSGLNYLEIASPEGKAYLQVSPFQHSP